MSDMHPANPWPASPQSPNSPPAPAPTPPSDAQTPWGWKELALFVAVSLASLFLLTELMASLAIVSLKLKPAEMETFATTNAVFLSLRQAIWYVVVIAYLYFTIRPRSDAPFWRTIGWRQLRPSEWPAPARYVFCLACGVALAIVVELGSFAFPAKKLPIEALFHDRRGVLWLMAVGILLAPAVEETIFRGYLYPVFARTLGVEGGILLTGVLFGMMHAPQLWRGWGQIGLLILVGIVLTYIRARTGTVLASWLLHLGYNSFLFAGFFISTSGLRHLPVGP